MVRQASSTPLTRILFSERGRHFILVAELHSFGGEVSTPAAGSMDTRVPSVSDPCLSEPRVSTCPVTASGSRDLQHRCSLLSVLFPLLPSCSRLP